MHPDDGSPPDLVLVSGWLEKWKGTVSVKNYSTGGWEHCWDVESPLVALRDIPKRLFCLSDWANYPQQLQGPIHKSWATHFDDGKKDSA
jgi:hypothetical protein